MFRPVVRRDSRMSNLFLTPLLLPSDCSAERLPVDCTARERERPRGSAWAARPSEREREQCRRFGPSASASCRPSSSSSASLSVAARTPSGKSSRQSLRAPSSVASPGGSPFRGHVSQPNSGGLTCPLSIGDSGATHDGDRPSLCRSPLQTTVESSATSTTLPVVV
jgi:hypothetical protein